MHPSAFTGRCPIAADRGVADGMRIEPQKQKTGFAFTNPVKKVEVAGFEPAAFWSRTKRATKLRYTSTKMEPIMGLEPMTC